MQGPLLYADFLTAPSNIIFPFYYNYCFLNIVFPEVSSVLDFVPLRSNIDLWKCTLALESFLIGFLYTIIKLMMQRNYAMQIIVNENRMAIHKAYLTNKEA